MFVHGHGRKVLFNILLKILDRFFIKIGKDEEFVVDNLSTTVYIVFSILIFFELASLPPAMPFAAQFAVLVAWYYCLAQVYWAYRINYIPPKTALELDKKETNEKPS